MTILVMDEGRGEVDKDEITYFDGNRFVYIFFRVYGS